MVIREWVYEVDIDIADVETIILWKQREYADIKLSEAELVAMVFKLGVLSIMNGQDTEDLAEDLGWNYEDSNR